MRADSNPDPGAYDAVVLGSAVYMGHWMKGATGFGSQHRAALASRPAWLFSSGPLTLGDGITEDDPDVVPQEATSIREAISPRDHRVFFGALDPQRLGFSHPALRRLPAARAALPEGDFRDWQAIETWTNGIAQSLVPGEP